LGRGTRLLGLNEDRVLKKAVQDGLDVMNVFLPGLGEDKDIVQVEKKVIQHVSEHVVH